MGFASEEAYEEMIQTLKNFKSQTTENCATISKAAEDCVDNTCGDPASVKSRKELGAVISKIAASLDTVDAVIDALQKQLDAIIEANKKA